MSLKTRITSDRSLVSLVRRAVTEYAKMRGGFNADALDDIELAVGEALANAVSTAIATGVGSARRAIAKMMPST